MSGEVYFWAPCPVQIWIPVKVDPGSLGKDLKDKKTEVKVIPVLDKGLLPATSSTEKGVTKPFTTTVGKMIVMEDKYAITDAPDDFIGLTEVNEATILHSSRHRFSQKLIYTACGDVLMALNPFERIAGLYSNQKMADRAYSAMCSFGRDQSILISGESGAGKTEATKQCLAFLANIAGATNTSSEAVDIANRIVAASPILEAFGNAMTLRNPNSSRFGKWMTLNFNDSNRICGSTVVSYLLEKGRVTKPNPGERNYHVFYQILRGMSSEELQSLAISADTMKHRYINSSFSGREAPDLDDKSNYLEMVESFNAMGFTQKEQTDYFKLVAGILLLGNVDFAAEDEGESSSIVGEKGGVEAAEHFGVDENGLRRSLITKTMSTGARGSIVTKRLNVDAATSARDSLARAVYDRLFKYIIKRINAKNETKGSRLIGLLDIFGFEIFEQNSFEQLCINYCNEMLQNHFNYVIFTAEKRLYSEEGVECASIDFNNNDMIIADIELTFKDLDEEARIPKGTSVTWYGKLLAKCSQSKTTHQYETFHVPPKRDNFTIMHYAGAVAYVPENFMEKNMETLNPDLIGLMTASESELTQELFADAVDASSAEGADAVDASSAEGAGKRRAAQKSISKNFYNQLKDLMNMLRATDSHFIRCIKSNAACKPLLFDVDLVQRQLLYSGVFEVIKIQQSGLPFRLTKKVYQQRYCCLVSDVKKRWSFAKEEDIVAFLKDQFKLQYIQCGKSLVFYKGTDHRILEVARNALHEKNSYCLQKFMRMVTSRKAYKRLISTIKKFESFMEDLNVTESRNEVRILGSTIKAISNLAGVGPLLEDLESNSAKRMELLSRQVSLVNRLKDLLAAVQSPSNFEKLSECISEAHEVELAGNIQVKSTESMLKRYVDAKDFAVKASEQSNLGDYTKNELDVLLTSLTEFKEVLPNCTATLKSVRTKKLAFERELNELLPKMETAIQQEIFEMDGDGNLKAVGSTSNSASGAYTLNTILKNIVFEELQSGD
eukprot:GSChrysophyteH2.ASY1.ANO1.1309.1 assembled CDS